MSQVEPSSSTINLMKWSCAKKSMLKYVRAVVHKQYFICKMLILSDWFLRFFFGQGIFTFIFLHKILISNSNHLTSLVKKFIPKRDLAYLLGDPKITFSFTKLERKTYVQFIIRREQIKEIEKNENQKLMQNYMILQTLVFSFGFALISSHLQWSSWTLKILIELFFSWHF